MSKKRTKITATSIRYKLGGKAHTVKKTKSSSKKEGKKVREDYLDPTELDSEDNPSAPSLASDALGDHAGHSGSHTAAEEVGPEVGTTGHAFDHRTSVTVSRIRDLLDNREQNESKVSTPSKSLDAELLAPEVDYDERDDARAKKEMGFLYKAGTVLLLGLAVGAEVVSHVTTGKSLFLDILNQGAEATRNVNAFQKFFEENPAGQAIEGFLEFLSSKPVKRVLRLIVLGTAFAAGAAGTGGGLAIAGLVIACTSIAVFSVREYIRERKVKKQIALNKSLFELSEQLAKTNEITKGVNKSLNEKLAEFIFDGVSENAAPFRKPVSPVKNLAKAIVVNVIECSGALLSGDFREFAAIFGLGTMREFKFNQNHATLRSELARSNNTLCRFISASCGLGKARYFSSPEQVVEAKRRQEFVAEYVKKHKSELEVLTPDQIDERMIEVKLEYNRSVEAEKQAVIEAKNKLPFYKKAIENIKAFANNKFVEPILGYLRTWNPYKKYSPETEKDNVVERGQSLSVVFASVRDPSIVQKALIERVHNHSEVKVSQTITRAESPKTVAVAAMPADFGKQVGPPSAPPPATVKRKVSFGAQKIGPTL